jgi:hypothetical protein
MGATKEGTMCPKGDPAGYLPSVKKSRKGGKKKTPSMKYTPKQKELMKKYKSKKRSTKKV